MAMKLAINYVRPRPETGAATCGSSNRRMENAGMSVTNAARENPLSIEEGFYIFSSYLMVANGKRSQTAESEQNASDLVEASRRPQSAWTRSDALRL